MKKLLLGTTMLMGAVVLAGAAHADGAKATTTKTGGLSVGVGGFMDFQAGFASQDSAFETGAFSRQSRFQTDTEIHITVEGQADNGLKYGAVIELNADSSADGDADATSGNGSTGNADKSYLFLESSAGRLELGTNSPVTSTMQVSAASIAHGTGGIDGDFYDFVNIPAPFVTTQELPAAEASEGGHREDANKVSYYSPVFSGLQLGVSFTPDEGDTGTVAGSTGKLNGDNENVFDVGLSYSGNFSGVGVNSALVGEFGSSEAAATEDTSAWGLGLALDYMGFSVAGSYTDWSDSGLATGSTADTQHSWTAGAAYATGPFGVSVTYLDSTGSAGGVGSTDLDFKNLVVGADYTLAPGLVPYVEVSFFDTDDNVAGTADNNGNVVLVGAELTF